MKFLISCVFLFLLCHAFSQNLEGSIYKQNQGYGSYTFRFFKKNKVVFSSVNCNVKRYYGEYIIENDTIYCKYDLYHSFYSLDSLQVKEQLSDSLKIELNYNSEKRKNSDICKVIIIDSASNFKKETTLTNNIKATLFLPRSLKKVSIIYDNGMFIKNEDFNLIYHESLSKVNTIKYSLSFYSNEINREGYHKLYFDQTDPTIMWLNLGYETIQLKKL
jgi:hypothetical protein